ncbi:MAG: hypothetical protein RLZZ316_1795 [Bacteroidota bacterium]
MIYVVYLLLVCICALVPLSEAMNLNFYLLTSLMVVFNFIQLRKVYKTKSSYFFISPVFLGTLVTFGLALGGVTNFILFKNGRYDIKELALPILFDNSWLIKTMFVICIASAATWFGYGLNAGNIIYKKFVSLNIYRKVYSSSINENRLILIAIIAYAVKFYLYSIGLWGRIVDDRYFEAGVGFKAGSQIRVLGELSYLSFFIISIFKFRHNNAKYNALFFISLAVELFFGFIYGARSTFITPFLIIFIAYYYVSKKINVSYLLVIFAAVLIAFTVVLDYKNYTLDKQFVKTESALDAISNFQNYSNRYAQSKNSYELSGTLERTFNSTTFVQEAAMSIRQVDDPHLGEFKDPGIALAMVRFPIDAFVPKFIQGQNEFPWGLWFKDEVLNYQVGLKYSIAMSPVGFLYMGGGLILVIIGFMIYGIVLKMTYNFLLVQNIFSLLTYMALLSVVYNLDSVVSGFLVMVTRYVIIFPLIFWVIFDPAAFRKLNN